MKSVVKCPIFIAFFTLLGTTIQAATPASCLVQRVATSPATALNDDPNSKTTYSVAPNSSLMPHKSVVSVACNNQTQPDNKVSTATCNNGTWSAQIGTCSSSCLVQIVAKSPATALNNNPNSKTTYSVDPKSSLMPHKSVVSVACINQTQLDNNVSTATCNNGTWSAKIGTCLPVTP